MKSNLKKIMLCGIILFVGCTKADDEMVQPASPVEKTPLVSTIELVNNFAATHQGDGVTKSTREEMKVLTHEVKTYSFDLSEELSSSASSRSTDVTADPVDVYTITFEKDGQQGYCIASSDERINKVYAYVENGALTDTTYILGLAATISYIPGQLKVDLIRHYTEESTSRGVFDKYVIIQPVTRLAWDQIYPYNKYAPPCSAGSGGYSAAGCVAVAVGQAMAAIKPTALETAYNLSNLKNSYAFSTTDPTADDCARLLYMIGAKLNHTYGCNLTLAFLKNIRPALDEWGVRYTYKGDANVDHSYLFNCLNYGRPHLTSGMRKKPREGHAWLWTGIDCTVDPGTVAPNIKVTRVHSLYCNWGWGPRSNGWFASYEQPFPDQQPYLDDNEQIYLLSSGR